MTREIAIRPEPSAASAIDQMLRQRGEASGRPVRTGVSGDVGGLKLAISMGQRIAVQEERPQSGNELLAELARGMGDLFLASRGSRCCG